MTYDGILLGRAARFGDESTHPVETDVKKETWAYTRLQSPWPSHLHSSTSTRKGLCFDVSTCNREPQISLSMTTNKPSKTNTWWLLQKLFNSTPSPHVLDLAAWSNCLRIAKRLFVLIEPHDWAALNCCWLLKPIFRESAARDVWRQSKAWRCVYAHACMCVNA